MANSSGRAWVILFVEKRQNILDTATRRRTGITASTGWQPAKARGEKQGRKSTGHATTAGPQACARTRPQRWPSLATRLQGPTRQAVATQLQLLLVELREPGKGKAAERCAAVHS